MALHVSTRIRVVFWIDYERFHELIKERSDFQSEDYAAPTPDWAIFGSDEAGFDPKETKFRKLRNHS